MIMIGVMVDVVLNAISIYTLIHGKHAMYGFHCVLKASIERVKCGPVHTGANVLSEMQSKFGTFIQSIRSMDGWEVFVSFILPIDLKSWRVDTWYLVKVWNVGGIKSDSEF